MRDSIWVFYEMVGSGGRRYSALLIVSSLDVLIQEVLAGTSPIVCHNGVRAVKTRAMSSASRRPTPPSGRISDVSAQGMPGSNGRYGSN